MTDKMSVKRKRGQKTTTYTRRKKKQQLKNRQTDDWDWAGLVDYLLELVINRLLLVDCLSFSRVCKPWKSVTTKLFEGSARGIPLLVKPGQSESITRTCLNVLDQNKNLSFDIRMPEYTGNFIWGSYHDWLFLGRVIDDYVHITLLNPFSREKILLPKTDDEYHMVVLSSTPSDPKCIYMLVRWSCGVDFWTPSARQWHKCDFMGSEGLVDALHHEGRFYVLRRSYEMVIIDEADVVNILNAGKDNESRITTQNLSLKVPCFEISGDVRVNIVKSNGDILLMCHIYYKSGPQGLKARGLETFRLVISQMAWVKLEDLGQKVIFSGRSCSRSFHAKELGDAALENNIYFSNNSYTNRLNEWDSITKYLDVRDDADDWGVFSLHKESSVWPRAFREPGKHFAGFWLTAPVWWCLRQGYY